MRTRVALIALLSLILVPAAARAQGSIAGVVRDASGAVLPGVTVEASSPELIEKSRSAVTDRTGQYRFVDLRPGGYAVTFTLAGFSTLKREGIEVAGSFIATVNVELKIGAVAETITVTAGSPVVDVQSTSQQRVVSKDVLDSIPAGRGHKTSRSSSPASTQRAGRWRHEDALADHDDHPRQPQRGPARDDRWIHDPEHRAERSKHQCDSRHGQHRGSDRRLFGGIGRADVERLEDQLCAASRRQHLQRVGLRHLE